MQRAPLLALPMLFLSPLPQSASGLLSLRAEGRAKGGILFETPVVLIAEAAAGIISVSWLFKTAGTSLQFLYGEGRFLPTDALASDSV